MRNRKVERVAVPFRKENAWLFFMKQLDAVDSDGLESAAGVPPLAKIGKKDGLVTGLGTGGGLQCLKRD